MPAFKQLNKQGMRGMKKLSWRLNQPNYLESIACAGVAMADQPLLRVEWTKDAADQVSYDPAALLVKNQNDPILVI